MTHDEALAEVEQRQRSDPDGKWIAAERDGQWVVARLGVAPDDPRPTGTTTQPPPPAPRDRPYSEAERISRLYGAA